MRSKETIKTLVEKGNELFRYEKYKQDLWLLLRVTGQCSLRVL